MTQSNLTFLLVWLLLLLSSLFQHQIYHPASAALERLVLHKQLLFVDAEQPRLVPILLTREDEYFVVKRLDYHFKVVRQSLRISQLSKRIRLLSRSRLVFGWNRARRCQGDRGFFGARKQGFFAFVHAEVFCDQCLDCRRELHLKSRLQVAEDVGNATKD